MMLLEISMCVILKDNLFNYNITSYSNKAPKIQLYVGNQFIKEWKVTVGYMGDSINSPLNYDSWEIVKCEDVVELDLWVFVHGELVFTINNEDLN